MITRFCAPILAQSIRAQSTGAMSLRAQAPKISPNSLYEPEIKDTRLYPEYETVNVRLQGFDYAPLERYQHYVHKMAKHFKFNVEDG